MEDNLESRTTATADSGSDAGSSSSTLAYDKHFVCSTPGMLTLIEVVSVTVWAMKRLIEWSSKVEILGRCKRLLSTHRRYLTGLGNGLIQFDHLTYIRLLF